MSDAGERGSHAGSSRSGESASSLAEKETGRVEAFSDGVFAIAITLLILEIKVPEAEHTKTDGEIFAALGRLWPSYIAFVASFFVILIMWVNHHEFLRLVRRVDYPFLFANGAVLLVVTFVPFPTAVLAEHLGLEGSRAAAALYCGTFFLASVSYNAMFLSVAKGRRLLKHDVTDEQIARIRRAYASGIVVYALAVLLALWNAWVGLGLCLSLWILWTNLCYQSSRPSSRTDR